ncbi:keratin-associated protein 24-1 [Acomys russatus]|uniref:keratin-associated protein 24-1 n=1 Tax=Acomys russatus TaxID=60746 RepID=UPI0021E32E09|nr:keratin-associated protein 24-1 [Acomys russatus]
MPNPHSCLLLALSVSMSLLGYPGLCSATSHRNHCYLPVTPSIAVCSNDINPAFGHYLPSSYQGNLWLLDHCQDSYCEVPCCESSNHELKTCTATCDPRNSCVPCNSPSATQVVSAGETTNIRSRPSCSPNTGTKRYVSNCTPATRFASKACQTSQNGSRCIGQFNYFPKNLQALYHYSPGNNGYRSYKNFGFISNGSSPSYYITSSYQPQSYLVRYCQYPNYVPLSFPPGRYLCGNFQSLSCIPSTFPPLRYLCSSNRPLNCY